MVSPFLEVVLAWKGDRYLVSQILQNSLKNLICILSSDVSSNELVNHLLSTIGFFKSRSHLNLCKNGQNSIHSDLNFYKIRFRFLISTFLDHSVEILIVCLVAQMMIKTESFWKQDREI